MTQEEMMHTSRLFEIAQKLFHYTPQSHTHLSNQPPMYSTNYRTVNYDYSNCSELVL